MTVPTGTCLCRCVDYSYMTTYYMQYHYVPLLGRGVVLPCVLSEDVYCVHVQDAWYTVLHICMLECMQYVYVSVIPCLCPTGLLYHYCYGTTILAYMPVWYSPWHVVSLMLSYGMLLQVCSAAITTTLLLCIRSIHSTTTPVCMHTAMCTTSTA